MKIRKVCKAITISLIVISMVMCMTLSTAADTYFYPTYNSSGYGTITISNVEYCDNVRIGNAIFCLFDQGNGHVSTYLNMGGNAGYSNPSYMYVYSRNRGNAYITEWVTREEQKSFATQALLLDPNTIAFIYLTNYYFTDSNSTHHYVSEYEVLWTTGSTSFCTISSGIYYGTTWN